MPRDENGYLLLSKTFASLVVAIVSTGVIALTAWAWRISQDVSAIRVEIRALRELRVTQISQINRRLDRHEQIIDGLASRLNLVEGTVP